MPAVNKRPVLLSSGGLDTSFSGDALTSTAIGLAYDQARGIAIQSDGRIVVAGTTASGIDTNIALARYNTDGSLDTTFDVDGKLPLKK